MKFISRLTLFVLAAALLSSPLLALTGREIVEKSEEAVRANSVTGTYEITVKTRRWTRAMGMKYQEMRKARKSFAEILSPRKDASPRHAWTKTSWVSSSAAAGSAVSRRQTAWTRPTCPW